MPLYGNLIFRAIPFFRKVAPISCPWRQTAYGCCFRTREQKGTPTLRQYQSASLLNLLCFVSFTGENPTSSFLSLSLLSGSKAWYLSSSTVWRKEPGNSTRSARLNLHSVFQTTLCFHPHASPLVHCLPPL